eukprot:SAG31_NODE_15489_length_752_cov_1.411945_1_plen_31_part_10
MLAKEKEESSRSIAKLKAQLAQAEKERAALD